MKTIFVNVRRLDCNDPAKETYYEFNVKNNINIGDFKKEVFDLLHIKDVEEKVIKVRNDDGYLVPLKVLMEENSPEKLHVIEITNVHQNIPAASCNSPLYSVYVNALQKKVCDMESRVGRVEKHVPQLKWRRQVFLENTTHSLGSKIAFLDRRVDELMPIEWHDHIQNSVNFPF